MKLFLLMVLIAVFCTLGLSSPLPSDTAAEGKSLGSSSQPETIPSPNSGSSVTGDLDTANTLFLGFGGYGAGLGYGGGYGYGGYPYYGGHRNWYGGYGGYGYRPYGYGIW